MGTVRTLGVAVLGLLAILVAAPAPAAAEPGDLAALFGDASCLSAELTACRPGRGLDGAESIALSPDGQHAYVASGGGGTLAVLQRDPVNGVLRQPAPPEGCLGGEGEAEGCQPAVGLEGAYGVALSPDGLNVYVAAFRSNAVTTFARDPASGFLRQLGGIDGCVVEFDLEAGTPCSEGRGLVSVSSVVVSPDGRNVYAASDRSDAVVAFARDPASGGLRQLPGLEGCISNSGTGGACTRGDGLDGAEGVTISPDGRNVYVAASAGGAVAVFARDEAIGALRQLDGPAGCRVTAARHARCALAPGLGGAWSATVSPDGAVVHVASLASSSLATFARDPATGALAPLPPPYGCLRTPPVVFGPCAPMPRLGGVASVRVSATGDRLYAASFTDDLLQVFARDAGGGVAPRSNGCFSQRARPGCLRVPGLDGVSSVAVAADGRNVYAVSDVADAVVAFAREPYLPAPTLTYAPSAVARRGRAVRLAPDVVALRGVRFAVTPALPAGLRLDPATGILAGRPRVGSPPVAYTVTATDAVGTASATLVLSVR